MRKPEHLAKYLSLENPKYAYSTITCNQLFFSDVEDFNDPFEINPALFQPKKFKPVFKPNRKILTSDTMKRVFEKLWINQSKKLRKSGVCCFTEVTDNIAMWAHYANKHKGICLIFNTNYKFFRNIQNVQYVPKRPQMVLFERKNSPGLLDLMRTKLETWKDEKEWRLFRRQRKRNYKYPATALRGIIFGLRCSKEDRSLVAHLAKGKSIKYFEARMSKYAYKLEIVEIKM